MKIYIKISMVHLVCLIFINIVQPEATNTKCCRSNGNLGQRMKEHISVTPDLPNQKKKASHREYEIPHNFDKKELQRVKRDLQNSSYSGNEAMKDIFHGFRRVLQEIINGQRNIGSNIGTLMQILNQSIALRDIADSYNKNEHLETKSDVIDLKKSLGAIKGKLLSEKMKVKKLFFKNYFRRISGSKVVSGIDVSRASGSSKTGVETVQKIAGVSPGMIGMSMPIYNSDSTKWVDFMDEVISNWKNHQFVRIVWWERSPLDVIKSFASTNNTENDERSWEDLIEDGGHLNNVWKRQLDIIVPYLQKLQSAGVITIIDIFPNLNHKKYIWRGRPGLNGTSKLYRITRDYLTQQHNLTSLIWTWSLWRGGMTQFEDFWPGNEYVDVASIYMDAKKELPFTEYERLVNLVGDKPLSMEYMWTVPSLQLLATQPRWTWFTAYDRNLEITNSNSASNIKATFNSVSVINKGNINFFNDFNE